MYIQKKSLILIQLIWRVLSYLNIFLNAEYMSVQSDFACMAPPGHEMSVTPFEFFSFITPMVVVKDFLLSNSTLSKTPFSDYEIAD